MPNKDLNVKRRKFLAGSAAAGAFAALAPALGLAATDRRFLTQGYDPPNILLVLMDGLRRDGFGIYGEKPVKTPVIDALARKGVLFDNHYAPTTLCTPSRASVITGNILTGTACTRLSPRPGSPPKVRCRQ